MHMLLCSQRGSCFLHKPQSKWASPEFICLALLEGYWKLEWQLAFKVGVFLHAWISFPVNA